jgi:hypothetical protein
MATIDIQKPAEDSVITELHRNKRAIAREHGDDIARLVRALQQREAGDSRVLTGPRGEQAGRGNGDSRI